MTTEETSKPKIPTLTHGNYYEWYHAVGNELYAIDAELLFEKAAPTHTGAEQTGKVDATDVDEKTRKKAYIMILRSLPKKSKLSFATLDAAKSKRYFAVYGSAISSQAPTW